MLLHCNNYAFKRTPSYPPVRGRLDTETSLEEGKKERKEGMKGRNARMNERKKRKRRA